jgi:hypothetical protein
MCIVIYKPANIEIPVQQLRNSFVNNPHGAGFMWLEGDKVRGSKGYMSLDRLLKSLEGLNFLKDGKLNSEFDMVLHFRFATHGGISAGKCHPFPASKDEDDLHLLEWEHTHGVAHNGIISNYAEKGLSDTQGFIKQVLSDKELLTDLGNKTVLKLLANITVGSKFIVFSPTNVILLGSWLKDNEVYYSNDDYKMVYQQIATCWDDFDMVDYQRHVSHEGEESDVIDVVDYMENVDCLKPHKLYDFCEHEDSCQECQFVSVDGMSCDIWGDYYEPNHPFLN